MPRSRSKAKPRTTAPPAPITNTPKQGVIKVALTADQISALLGSTRTKGVYVKYLNDFVDSGEAGICVNEQWADLKDKKGTTLKQGFENAKTNKEAPENADKIVKVLLNEDKVYLINLEVAGVEAEVEEAA